MSTALPEASQAPRELTGDLINMLNAMRPNFGDVGTRDVDVAAQRRRIDQAIIRLGPILAHDGREHPAPRLVAAPAGCTDLIAALTQIQLMAEIGEYGIADVARAAIAKATGSAA